MAVVPFEDLRVWKKSRALAQAVYEISGRGKFARDFALRDQIRRAAVSIISNIAEGHERDGNREFLQFLHHAKGSAGEVRAQLHLAADLKYLDETTHERLVSDCKEVSRMLAALIAALRRSGVSGKKYDPRHDRSQSS